MPPAHAAERRWRRYVAIGDSFTEGLCDPAPGNGWRGWADRLAEALALRAADAGQDFDYANFAIRGRLLPQIIDEQFPLATALHPDLVSIVGGGNDVLRPGVDIDAITARLERAVVRLRGDGVTVIMSTAYDPWGPLVRRTRGLAAVFTAHVWSIAGRHGAHVLDLWGMPALRDRRMWAEDRIHLTAEGHRRVALHALDILGIGTEPHDDDGSATQAEAPPRGRGEAWREDAAWLRHYVLPWVGRRLRGRSSGDGLVPKRPIPLPVSVLER